MSVWKLTQPSRSLSVLGLALGCALIPGCLFIESPQEGERAGPARSATVLASSESDTAYMKICRANNVPIPPDWKPSASEWERHGNLGTILLTPNHMDKVQADDTTFASVWSYASPTVRGACLALGRNGGTFQVICQSATTGHACFWGNDPGQTSSRWTPATTEVTMASLSDPEQGFAPGTVACTECHRGTNAFLVAPDDPTWATVLRAAQARPTFTTRVEQSSPPEQAGPGGIPITNPRFIPIGGKTVALKNPLPTIPGCSGACHEAHYEILDKGHTTEGYVRIPRPMGPNCARNSPENDPTRNCYHN
ncbi:MAG: hypothetical protein BVN28_00275 [Nitrospira sp. ST-bin4]|nr:MAG: hypothetical protein BVN28_00275 [Nitrospira sp. ST-bin4]